MEGSMYEWKPEYDELVKKFAKQHLGPKGYANLSRFFPCMRNEYAWGEHRPDVMDSRVPIKNNTEYHGLETYAKQYHVTAQYEESYHHWLMAADWRRQDMLANGFTDQGHKNAITFAIKQALYNKSLSEWQGQQHSGYRSFAPKPEDFDLSSDMQRKMDEKCEKEFYEITSANQP
jgi:hypothetical protein